MEKIVRQGLLYDFYGELLTEHQRLIYEKAVYEDLSLKELSEEYGITRQGIHDLIRRCDRILSEYESKLHMVERFEKIRELVKGIDAAAGEARENGADEIRGLCAQIMENL